jgi:hypothetical protein
LYQNILTDEQFLSWLLCCDRDLAEKARQGGCPRCGGRLHRANYPRKPRGVPTGAAPELALRFSFCCSQDGCRRRVTPPSLRFLGRRVYLGLVLVLAQVLRSGASPARVGEIERLVGVSAHTLRRWRLWWQTTLVASRFWQAARGQFCGRLNPRELPQALLDLFGGDARARMHGLLRFLSPISGSATADQGRVP